MPPLRVVVSVLPLVIIAPSSLVTSHVLVSSANALVAADAATKIDKSFNFIKK